MEKKKVDLGAVAAEAGKNAKAFWGKAKEAIVNAADQNDDGSLDFKDVSVIAESIGNAAKSTAASVIILISLFLLTVRISKQRAPSILTSHHSCVKTAM